MKRAIDFVLSRENLFINTSSDATLLERSLEAIAQPTAEVDLALLTEDAQRLGVEALFVRDVSDDVIISAADYSDPQGRLDKLGGNNGSRALAGSPASRVLRCGNYGFGLKRNCER